MTHSFHPPARTLLGPGPSDVSPRVLEALSRPTIGHLDPAFIRLMDEIKRLLQFAFRTENALTLPVSAPGSAGMECCFVNLVSPGDKVIVAQNGVFGGRMKENVERCGGTPVMVQDDWGKTVDPQKVADAIRQHGDARVLAFVHAETSTGVYSDADALCGLARQHGLLTIVDTVTSLGGIDVDVDRWGADAVYSGSQKCLSCIPGLSPVTFSARAQEHIRQRRHKVQSWFLDMGLVMAYWGGTAQRTYHHTAPVNPLYALHEALAILEEEGLEAAWARHRRHHLALADGFAVLGMEFIVEAAHRLPQLNCVRVPAGADEALLRRQLLEEYDIEVGAGLGPLAGKVWRVGLMGHSANRRNVLTLLGALEALLGTTGAVAAARARYAAAA
ncbi:MAG: alanine--glyoxylate aminotransferase family protein [Gammaproteobacteria bacterium PRO9]|nr:alanine--glyoxylate aminotransferase family protein [Gammaproteobacteria bacterium PRO9]